MNFFNRRWSRRRRRSFRLTVGNVSVTNCRWPAVGRQATDSRQREPLFTVANFFDFFSYSFEEKLVLRVKSCHFLDSFDSSNQVKSLDFRSLVIPGY